MAMLVFCALTCLKIYCRLTRHSNVDLTLAQVSGRWKFDDRCGILNNITKLCRLTNAVGYAVAGLSTEYGHHLSDKGHQVEFDGLNSGIKASFDKWHIS